MNAERVAVAVIGGGQAGLAAGYHLAASGREFVILDAAAEPGAAWRRRWDSLRLFTQARYSALPGMRLPGPGGRYPVKDEMADYFGAYIERFDLPVRHDTRIERLSRRDGGFLLTAGSRQIVAKAVVVATGPLNVPRIPPFADALDPDIYQLHSDRYQRPDQLPDGPALVVGAGNSGAEIALELARTRATVLAGRGTGTLPLRLGPRLTWLIPHHLTVSTRPGRRLRDRARSRGTPWIRVDESHFRRAGIRRIGRITGARDGLPLAEGDETIRASTVIWCSGYESDYRWIDIPGIRPHELPAHQRGVLPATPGLYFLGLPFQYALSSALVGGVGRDAAYVVRHIA